MKSCPQCNLRYPEESTRCYVDGSELVPMQDPRIGTTIAGRYVIEDVLGEGGMATVYRARHKLVDRPCAIKIMNPALARDRVVRERFRREAKAAQQLAHPNIIEIFDHGDTDDGTAFLVMELLRGESLADRIASGPMQLRDALPLMVQMSRALARAHDFEVVHRDLKPENIFVARSASGADLIKLLDFGIARSMRDTRLTGVGEVFGTPQYMAPERITSIDAGPPADLYALGIIFFEMLTGTLPFDAPDIPTFFVKHMKEPPPRLRVLFPDLPDSIETLVDRLLAKDPKNRPVDAHSVHADLVKICGEVGATVPPDPSTESEGARGPAPTLPPVAIDRWVHRTALFDQMLQRAFGKAPPPEMSQGLERIRELVRAAGELRQQEMQAQRGLEAVEQRGREGRQRFGIAMDALGVDASAARRQVREVQEQVAKAGEQIAACKERLKVAHKEVLYWEGRSAMAEPYVQLSEAYRAAADVIEQWSKQRKVEREAQSLLADKEKQVVDLDFQIRELRKALGELDKNTSAEKASFEARCAELDRQADGLEAQLSQMASQFCAPLRARPELAALFREIDSAAAA